MATAADVEPAEAGQLVPADPDGTAPATRAERQAPRDQSGPGSRRLALIVMCAGYFLLLLDVTIVNVALPSIASGLGAGVSGLQWVVDGYAISLASLMLAGGTVGDLHGHKRIVMVGLATFGVGSLACGAARTTGVLVGARILQGVGAACLLPGSLAIITHAFPKPQEQAKAIGIWAGVGSVALPAGPLLGGALIEAVGWRGVFLINLPIVILALTVAARVIHESTDARGRRPDPAGTMLGAGVLAVLTFAFVETGRVGPDTPVVIAIVVAIAGVAAFLAVERARAEPMLPLELFRRPSFTVANAVAGAMNLGTLGMLFVLTLYLQTVQHRSALTAGVAVLPLFLPLSIIAPFAGRVTARLGPKLPMAAGLLTAAVGVGLLTRVDPDSTYRALLPGLLLWGVGMGILTPAVVAAAMSAVPAPRAGLASATNNTARQAGGALGIAAFGALAGSASHRGAFVAGLHTDALITVGLWLTASLATLALIPQIRPTGSPDRPL
jgi:MFS transporter, DHA2 family, methylenomycin A resistance protein